MIQGQLNFENKRKKCFGTILAFHIIRGGIINLNYSNERLLNFCKILTVLKSFQTLPVTNWSVAQL